MSVLTFNVNPIKKEQELHFLHFESLQELPR